MVSKGRVFTGRKRLAAGVAILVLMLGLASCSRFKTMWLCAKGCNESTDAGVPKTAASGGDGGAAGPARRVDAEGRPEGALIRTRKLTLVLPTADDHIKMRKESSDEIYVFFYKPKHRGAIELVEPGVVYNINFRLKLECPPKADHCGTFVTADEE